VRMRSLIAAMHAYRAIAADDEAVAMIFIEGNLLRRYGHPDEALPLFRDIVDNHPEHEVAEYAAAEIANIVSARP